MSEPPDDQDPGEAPADGAPPPARPNDPSDPFGDRAFIAGKKPNLEIIDGGKPAKADRPKPDPDIAALRAGVMDLDRVDLDALIEAEARTARRESGIAWEPDDIGLPPHCPVTPLGARNNVFYFLTPNKEMIELAAGNFGQSHIDALFAPQTNYLVVMWGQSAPKSNKLRVPYEDVRRVLMNGATRRGVFDPGDKVRGRGAWKGADGKLIVHYGDHLWIDGEMREPGYYGGYVYPARPKMPPPSGDGAAKARAAAQKLLDAFACWRWARGALDARLLLGWLIVALMGAAVDWRPQIMLTGDAGTGKSTLQHLLKTVLGDRLLDVADATAAALYQTLGHDALAVGFDEFENEDDAKGAAVMRLARLASSGGRVARGGADGVPTNYQARGAFLFSAINPPAMRPAEQTRITILALRPLDSANKRPAISDAEAREIGGLLAQRVVSMWPFWHERLEQFRQTLSMMAHSARGQDQFGTLLAAADLALSDFPFTSSDYEEWRDSLAPGAMIETAGASPNWRRCLNHALAVQPDAWRSFAHKQVGAALASYLGDEDRDNRLSRAELQKRLALAGLALVKDGEGVDWLGFPARHPGLAKVYEGTDWSARRGADGAWINALAQAPDGLWRRDRFRCAGAREAGVLVKLDVVLETDQEEEDDAED